MITRNFGQPGGAHLFSEVHIYLRHQVDSAGHLYLFVTITEASDLGDDVVARMAPLPEARQVATFARNWLVS